MSIKNKKYKICIVTAILPPSYGGAEVAAFKYAARLHADPDSEVIVIGWDRAGAYEDSGMNYEFVHPVRINEKPKDTKGIFVYLQQLIHMWNCFKVLSIPMWKLRNRYDYVHNFNSGFAFNRVSILIAKLIGKKVVTETSLVGDDDPLSLGRILNWKDYLKPKYLRYIFYKMADRYVSKSEVITEIFRKSEIPMKKVAQIPYSVDIHKFKPLDTEGKKELRKKINIWEEGKIILFVGGINIRKGVHLLVDAFISIEKKYPDLKLLIVGPTYKYDQKYIVAIQDKIKSLNLGNKILLTEKNVSNVDEYMKSSDIFVLPSRQEGFPISIIESMSCGLAVVGSDIPEIAKTQITDGVDGYVFPKGEVDKLSEVLTKILDDKEATLRICNNARNKAVNNWSVEIVDKAYRVLYSSIGKKSIHKGRIKVLYTISKSEFTSGEKEKVFLKTISGLDKNVFDPFLFTYSENEHSIKSLSDENALLTEKLTETPSVKSREYSVSMMTLIRIFNKVNPDIIHSLSETDDYNEALAAKINGIKWVNNQSERDKKLINTKDLRFKLSDALINRSKIKNGSTEKGKHYSIPTGININEFSGIEKDEKLILKYNLKESNPIVLTSVDGSDKKGLETLIKGFALAHEDYENAKLIISGKISPEFKKTILNLIKEYGIKGNTVITGNDFEITKLYRIADLYIISNSKEVSVYNDSVLEAMAGRIICFGSDVNGLGEFFRKSSDQLFESENPGSIANKILFFMKLDETERPERIKRQIDFVKNNFSREKEVEMFEDLYKNLV